MLTVANYEEVRNQYSYNGAYHKKSFTMSILLICGRNNYLCGYSTHYNNLDYEQYWLYIYSYQPIIP